MESRYIEKPPPVNTETTTITEFCATVVTVITTITVIAITTIIATGY